MPKPGQTNPAGEVMEGLTTTAGFDLNTEEWMTRLPEIAKTRPISTIAIPGSHNSFTYSLVSKM